mmetsp:Transcript_26632/g.56278  ORF Transcript_26632/g.56278 Transcript_26632/m.56278 type:complete len:137 (-) Transcript_26632:169-579(-)|eukprot:CAMPEP_0183741520 /NCGR_PEP_ID=MMETSP0737-20130205/62320_1 /TAXON_ID=385413 /ORGANISM="Thalassiosira miniscula, Strain CCMP1093" /LENGTH=136 /DNA_ID=CAMNT_0025976871 /DNA_START=163 /DNA_END=573 /DNA_ORIENTATION=+
MIDFEESALEAVEEAIQALESRRKNKDNDKSEFKRTSSKYPRFDSRKGTPGYKASAVEATPNAIRVFESWHENNEAVESKSSHSCVSTKDCGITSPQQVSDYEAMAMEAAHDTIQVLKSQYEEVDINTSELYIWLI